MICGNNGQGKTNLLEAIWLLTGGKSFGAARIQSWCGGANPLPWLERPQLVEIKAVQVEKRRLNEFSLFAFSSVNRLRGVRNECRVSREAGFEVTC